MTGGRAFHVHPYAVPLIDKRARLALAYVDQHVGVQAGRLAQIVVVRARIYCKACRDVDDAAHAHMLRNIGLHLDVAESVPAGAF